MKIILTAACLLSIMLTGCLGDRGQQIDIIERALFSGSKSISKKDFEAVNRGEKALVLTRCTAMTPPSGVFIKNYHPSPCQTKWRHDSAENEVVELCSSKVQPISMNAIVPGKYELEYFKANNDDLWNTYGSAVYVAGGLINIASFTVSGGEVIYIGDMEFDFKGPEGSILLISNMEALSSKGYVIAKSVSVHNKVEQVKKLLLKKYPALSNKLQVRLIQLSKINLSK